MFYAHSTNDPTKGNWQPLSEHLKQAGRRAEEFATKFGCDVAHLARVAGLLHDIGKYTTEFQLRLSGDFGRVDHATAGAKVAIERYKELGYLLAFGIAGHHAGLANGRSRVERSSLEERLTKELFPLLDAWQKEIDLPEQLHFPQRFKPRLDRNFFQLVFLARMLFSCLVDADFLDTESFFEHVSGSDSQRGDYPALPQLRQELDRYLQGFKSASGLVNRHRAEILSFVRRNAELEPGLFSLTVPTGGGKTLSSLAFALDHAIRHGQTRIIYVIPFTSIVEQNAAVFRKAFGELGERAVLEHHSAFIDDKNKALESREKLKLAMENWEAPVVVTTAVQFFESLFADRPSKCRKLHSIANSVVILDEAQTLPLKLLRPCVAALDELALNYRASIVLCTATQPALEEHDNESESFVGGFRNVRELAPDPKRLYEVFRRVRVRYAGVLDDASITEHLADRDQALCIVNNRRHARALYQSIAELPGACHLSTLMCAKHRSEVLSEIRERLRQGLPCRLVSTSLIEAGVDIDFPMVMRAEAGLDSVAQAAGRCNREGKWDAKESLVLIFSPENEEWTPPVELTQFAGVSREVLRLFEDDPLALAAIERYFKQLYWQKGKELDAHDLLGRIAESGLEGMPFETLATKFRMIESVQMPVIVPFNDEAKAELRRLEFAEGCVGIARRLQPYVVQVPQQIYQHLLTNMAVVSVAEERFGTQFMQLVSEDFYDDCFGLCWDFSASMLVI